MTALPERLQDVVTEMRSVGTFAEVFGDRVHEWADRLVAATALQSSGGEVVAWRYRHPVEGDTGTWHDMPHGKVDPADMAHMNGLLADGCIIEYAYASPAQPSGFGEVCVVCDWKDADPFPRFIEAEVGGRSVRFDWRDRADGLKELVIPTQGETK